MVIVSSCLENACRLASLVSALASHCVGSAVTDALSLQAA